MDLLQYIKVDNQSGESFLGAKMNTGFEQSMVLPIGLNETQEFLQHKYQSIPIEKTYTVNATKLGYRDRQQDKLNVLMHYPLYNDRLHHLGKQLLPAGKFRIYQQDKQGTRVFVGEDRIQSIAKETSHSLYIGQARDIVVKRVIERNTRQKINGNLYNIEVVLKYEIENFKDQAVDLVIEEHIPTLLNTVFHSRQRSDEVIEWQIGDETSFSGKPIKKLTSSNKIAYKIHLPARQKGQKKAIKWVKKLHIIFNNEW
jgi:hypothetical protein